MFSCYCMQLYWNGCRRNSCPLSQPLAPASQETLALLASYMLLLWSGLSVVDRTTASVDLVLLLWSEPVLATRPAFSSINDFCPTGLRGRVYKFQKLVKGWDRKWLFFSWLGTKSRCQVQVSKSHLHLSLANIPSSSCLLCRAYPSAPTEGTCLSIRPSRGHFHWTYLRLT